MLWKITQKTYRLSLFYVNFNFKFNERYNISFSFSKTRFCKIYSLFTYKNPKNSLYDIKNLKYCLF